MLGKLFEGEMTRVYFILYNSSNRMDTSWEQSRRGLFLKLRGTQEESLECQASECPALQRCEFADGLRSSPHLHPHGPASLPACLGSSVVKLGARQELHNPRKVLLSDEALKG